MREFESRPATEPRTAPRADSVITVRARPRALVDQGTAHEREADDAAASAVRSHAAEPSAARPPTDGYLDGPTQTFFGRHFGHDFSQVRVHADDRAADVPGMLGASAMTVGNDIFFGRGAYQPHRRDGVGLLAHELAHVVQQSQSARPRLQGKLFAASDAAGFAAAANAIIAVQFEVVVSKSGEVTLQSTQVQGPPTAEAQELVRVIRLVSGDAKDTRIEFVHGRTSTRASDAMVLGGNYALSRVDLDDAAALGSQASAGVGMGRTGGSLLAHEVLEQFRKQVHGEGFTTAHAQATAAESAAVGGTRGAERFTNVTDTNNFTVTIPYTYPDGHVVDVTWDVVNGNYQNVQRKVVTPPQARATTP
ncbi:MAG: DUF4157 domain-containing protein [Cellulomonas sp.]